MDTTLTSKETLQNIAIKLAQEQLNNESQPSDKTIFVLGSPVTGKSTLINRFLDRDEAPKPTLALDYNFGRRTTSGQGIYKQICHFWELGSLENSNKLLEIPFRSCSDLKQMSLVVIVDLSEPKDLWNTINEAFSNLRKIISEKIGPNSDLTKLKVGKDHPDLKSLDLFPIPTLIVGGKYDLYQNFDPEIKKQICKCIRASAHFLGSAVLFYSTQSTTNTKTLRDVLNHFGFNSPSKPIRNSALDYNGSLIVPWGGDSWDKIGLKPSSFQEIGTIYSDNMKLDSKTQKPMPKDPAKDPDFKEPIIDELRAQKEEEFINLMRNPNIVSMFEKIE